MWTFIFLSIGLASASNNELLAPPPTVEALAGARGDAAPLPQKDTLITRVAFGSCIDPEQPIPILEAIQARNPRLMVMLGDNVYGDAVSGDPSLPELRRAYENLANNQFFRSFSASIPVLSVWDDHDYGLNDGGIEFAHKVEAERIFDAFWGVGEGDPRAEHEGVYGSFTFGPVGQQIQIILLDTRTHRSALKRMGRFQFWRKGRFEATSDHRQDMLGRSQWRWLEAALNKPADLRIVVSSVQVLPKRHGWERWGQMPMERAKLIDLLHRRDNVVIVSGDRHWATMYQDDFGLTEMTASSLNRPVGRSAPERDKDRVVKPFVDSNFGEIEVDWEARVATIRILDVLGQPVSKLAFAF
jgi:alkaline phosphatase D